MAKYINYMVAGIVLEYFKLLFLAIFMFTFCLLLLLTFPQVYLVCVYAQGHIHILDIPGGRKREKRVSFYQKCNTISSLWDFQAIKKFSLKHQWLFYLYIS